MINYLHHNHEQFQFVPPYTTRNLYFADETDGYDYFKVNDKEFKEKAEDSMDWLFVEQDHFTSTQT